MFVLCGEIIPLFFGKIIHTFFDLYEEKGKDSLKEREKKRERKGGKGDRNERRNGRG